MTIKSVSSDTDDSPLDDTSFEEEDTENEESDDTEEEEATDDEETSDDEGDEGEEGEEESSDSKPKQYLDLKSLPPELQEAGKRMLATHTKAMQAIPKLVEQKVAEAQQTLQQQYGSHIIKAKGFDELTKVPGFREFYEDAANGKPYGYSSKFRTNGKVRASDSDESGSFGEDKNDSTQDLEERLIPMINRLVERAIAPIKEERSGKIWKEAETNLKYFNKYRAPITAMLAEHPTLSIEQAYEIVAKEDIMNDVINDKLKKAEDRAKKLPKKSLKPSGGGSKPLAKDTIKSIDDALNFGRRKVLSGE